MRLRKILVTMVALALSGQAQAAKVFTLTGTTTGEDFMSLPYSFGPAHGSHTVGLSILFDQPIDAAIHFWGEYSYYDRNNDGSYYEANELPFDGYADFFGQQAVTFTTRLPTASIRRSSWPNTTQVVYQPLYANLAMSSASTVGYTISGFQAVPEPTTWALLIVGFGSIGAALRGRSRNRPALGGVGQDCV